MHSPTWWRHFPPPSFSSANRVSDSAAAGSLATPIKVPAFQVLHWWLDWNFFLPLPSPPLLSPPPSYSHGSKVGSIITSHRQVEIVARCGIQSSSIRGRVIRSHSPIDISINIHRGCVHRSALRHINIYLSIYHWIKAIFDFFPAISNSNAMRNNTFFFTTVKCIFK